MNLLWEKGVWYLEARCRKRGKRYFRVSRIDRLDVSEESFDRQPAPDEPEREATPGIRATLRFAPSARMRVLEQFPVQMAVHPPEAGDTVLPAVERVLGRPARTLAEWAAEHKRELS